MTSYEIHHQPTLPHIVKLEYGIPPVLFLLPTFPSPFFFFPFFSLLLLTHSFFSLRSLPLFPSQDDHRDEQSSLRQSIPIPLSTLTSNLLQGNTSTVPLTSRGTFVEYENSTNLLNLQIPSSNVSAHESSPDLGPTSSSSFAASRAGSEAQDASDAQPAQASLSYRDASQILLNPRRPSYKVQGVQGNSGKTQYFGADSELSGFPMV